jgi:hypothetical protein
MIPMPEDLEETISGSTELVFPDDAVDQTYSLQERSVYDAGEVREEMDSEIPEYGSWLPVDLDGDQAWLVAPSELRSVLVDQEIRTGERFSIDKMQKTGRGQSDPYTVEVSLPDREAVSEDQASLTGD